MRSLIIKLVFILLMVTPFNVSPMQVARYDFKQNEIDRLKRKIAIQKLDAKILIKEIKMNKND